MKETFIECGPDGTVTGEIRTRNAHETIALLRWMFALRDKGYRGPFLLELMLEKIRKEKR